MSKERESVSFIENYGPIVANREYELMEEKSDYVRVKCHGKPIYVPSNFIARLDFSQKGYKREILPTYEDIIRTEMEFLEV